MLAALALPRLAFTIPSIPIDDGPGEAITIREPHCVEAIRRLGTYDALAAEGAALRDLAGSRGDLVASLRRENAALSNACTALAAAAAADRRAHALGLKRERALWLGAAGAALAIGVVIGILLKR